MSGQSDASVHEEYSSDETALLSASRVDRVRKSAARAESTILIGCGLCLVCQLLLAAAVCSVLVPFLRLPSVAAPQSPETLAESLCPCACNQGPNVDYSSDSRRLIAPVSVTVQAPTVIVPPISVHVAPVNVHVAPVDVTRPIIPRVNVDNIAAGTPSPGACLAGDRCEFGSGWCSKRGHERIKPRGECLKNVCSGPDSIPYYPERACSAPLAPDFDITNLLGGVPGMLRDLLRDERGLNEKIKQGLKNGQLEDISIDVDGALTHHFDVSLDLVEVVWLVGCWPPQRYLVLNGAIRMPRGTITANVGGFVITTSFIDFEIRFSQLKVYISCHGGSFVLDGIGAGTDPGHFDFDVLKISGSADIHCDWPWTVLCSVFNGDLLLGIRARLLAEMPALLIDALHAVFPVTLNLDCPDVLRNSLAVLPYASKRCCEATFAVDNDKCLVGGQFNGLPPSFGHPVSGVECKEDATAPGTYRARCETLPGNYHELSIGVCRESTDTLTSQDGRAEGAGITGIYFALRVEPWIEMLFLLALCCCCCGNMKLCCRGKCGRSVQVDVAACSSSESD
eukprot:TRINITY_DN36781_c0_g1_i1.p1 TRINITY_DN36781_c0_g1~~TRINITY_DN36781_c0_g1_i1.p1  ORF type:complete len:566 (+),score=46.19 TRINITY_DN36781_c0_g1_i1:277-1974(+)